MIAYVLHGKKDLRPEERSVPVARADDVLVEVRRLGICGSDVHYFATGHCGAFVPKRPFVLGHEVAGEIVDVGANVTHLRPGARVAVDPSSPCGGCRHCRAGRTNLCADMRYLGSASTDPHVDGAFSRFVAVPASGCHVLSDAIGYDEAALLEPLSVATHAVKRAGSVAGKSVLILGAGTMGQLVLQVARAMGAACIAVTDVREGALTLAAAQGADATFRAGSPIDDRFEVIFEASGSPDALRAGLELADRGASLVQLGTLPDRIELPLHLVMQKELDLLGSFRFANVFGDALELLASRRVDVRPIVTHTFGFEHLVHAFETAVEDDTAMKVQVES